MITNSTLVFPNNIVAVVAARMQAIDADLMVVNRPLRVTDDIQSIGVYGVAWNPEDDSYEMLGNTNPGPNEPTLQQYLVTVQALIKDGDELRGLGVHSVLSSLIRATLYRDTTLRVGLAGLSVTIGSVTESARRWGIRDQRFLSNELSGSWLYLSNLTFWLETETS